MKKLLAFAILLALFSSCSTKTQKASIDFKMATNSIDNFYITWNEFTQDEKPFKVTYLVQGDIINKSKNIYKKAHISFDIVFVLKNGNELSANEIDSKSMFSGFSGSDFIYDWKPNEQRQFKLKSPRLDASYADYPIVKTKAVYTIEALDEINGQTTTETIQNIDISNKWEETVKRVKSGISDMSPSQLNKLF